MQGVGADIMAVVFSLQVLNAFNESSTSEGRSSIRRTRSKVLNKETVCVLLLLLCMHASADAEIYIQVNICVHHLEHLLENKTDYNTEREDNVKQYLRKHNKRYQNSVLEPIRLVYGKQFRSSGVVIVICDCGWIIIYIISTVTLLLIMWVWTYWIYMKWNLHTVETFYPCIPLVYLWKVLMHLHVLSRCSFPGELTIKYKSRNQRYRSPGNTRKYILRDIYFSARSGSTNTKSSAFSFFKTTWIYIEFQENAI